MEPEEFEYINNNFFNNLETNTRNKADTQAYLNALESCTIITIESLSETSLKKLLLCTLKIIELSKTSNAKRALKNLLLFLRKITPIFEIFDPTPKMLKKINLGRLLQGEYDEDGEVFDLMVFINKYYKAVTCKDFGLSEYMEERLRKEEIIRVWKGFDHIITKIDKIQSKLKDRGALTAKALKEIFDYIDKMKKTLQKRGHLSKSFNNDYNNTKDGSFAGGGMLSPNDLSEIRKEINILRETLDTTKRPFDALRAAVRDSRNSKGFMARTDPHRLNTKLVQAIEDLKDEVKQLKSRTKDLEKNPRMDTRNEPGLTSGQQTGPLNANNTILAFEDGQNVIPQSKTFYTSKPLENGNYTSNAPQPTLFSKNKELLDTLTLKFEVLESNLKDLKKQQEEQAEAQRRLQAAQKKPKPTPESTHFDLNRNIGIYEGMNEIKKIDQKLAQFIDFQTLMNQKLQKAINHKKSRSEVTGFGSSHQDGLNKDLERALNRGTGLRGSTQSKTPQIDEELEKLKNDVFMMTEYQKSLQADVELLKRRKTGSKTPLNLDKEDGGEETEREDLRLNQANLYESMNQKIILTNKKLEEVQNEFATQLRQLKKLTKDKSPDAYIDDKIKAWQEKMDSFNRKEQSIFRELENIESKISKLGGGKPGFSGTGGHPSNAQPTLIDEMNAELSPSALKKLKKIIQYETEDIVKFNREFVDECALKQISTIKSTKRTCTEKMEALEWVVRNIEFISPKLFKKMIRTCWEIKQKGKSAKKTLFYVKHDSDVIQAVNKLLTETQTAESNAQREALSSLLPSYLEALEVILLNEFNQEVSPDYDTHLVLTAVLSNVESERTRLKAVDCLALIIENGHIVNKCFQNNKFLEWISGSVDMFSETKNEELESLMKVYIACFKSFVISEKLLKLNKNLVNKLFRMLGRVRADYPGLQYHINAIFYFSKNSRLFHVIEPPELIRELVLVARMLTNEKLKKTIYACLRNFESRKEFAKIIQEYGLTNAIREQGEGVF